MKIQITEQDIRKMVSECIKKILTEGGEGIISGVGEASEDTPFDTYKDAKGELLWNIAENVLKKLGINEEFFSQKNNVFETEHYYIVFKGLISCSPYSPNLCTYDKTKDTYYCRLNGYTKITDWKLFSKTAGQGTNAQPTNESVEIEKKNKGKFTATKKKTGKSTEELTHSKNPLTKKRAIFAQNAKKWSHKKSVNEEETGTTKDAVSNTAVDTAGDAVHNAFEKGAKYAYDALKYKWQGRQIQNSFFTANDFDKSYGQWKSAKPSVKGMSVNAVKDIGKGLAVSFLIKAAMHGEAVIQASKLASQFINWGYYTKTESLNNYISDNLVNFVGFFVPGVDSIKGSIAIMEGKTLENLITRLGPLPKNPNKYSYILIDKKNMKWGQWVPSLPTSIETAAKDYLAKYGTNEDFFKINNSDPTMKKAGKRYLNTMATHALNGDLD